MFVDTHAHLYAEEFAHDRDEMIQRAIESGVVRMYLPNIDSESIEGMLELEVKYPGVCYAMMGLHPCYVREEFEEQLAVVEDWWSRRAFAAVGEIGIDLYWDKSTYEMQREAFSRQVDLAMKIGKPIVIHSRASTQEVIDTLVEKVRGKALRGIFHCFSGTVDQAMMIQELGFYVGIGGVVTFKNAGLDKVVQELPLELLVLETDSPYLAPVPYRGKRNESAYIPMVAARVAELKDVSVEEVAEVTTRNANALFGFDEGLSGD